MVRTHVVVVGHSVAPGVGSATGFVWVGAVFYVVVVVFVIPLGDTQLVDAVASAGGHFFNLIAINVGIGVFPTGAVVVRVDGRLVQFYVVVAERYGLSAPLERGVFAQVRIDHQRVVGAVLRSYKFHLRTGNDVSTAERRIQV